VAAYCGDCRAILGRLEGRGHEGEDGLVTAEALIENWRERGNACGTERAGWEPTSPSLRRFSYGWRVKSSVT
jgi:hypothetical protein